MTYMWNVTITVLNATVQGGLDWGKESEIISLLFYVYVTYQQSQVGHFPNFWHAEPKRFASTGLPATSIYLAEPKCFTTTLSKLDWIKVIDIQINTSAVYFLLLAFVKLWIWFKIMLLVLCWTAIKFVSVISRFQFFPATEKNL